MVLSWKVNAILLDLKTPAGNGQEFFMPELHCSEQAGTDFNNEKSYVQAYKIGVNTHTEKFTQTQD